MNAGFVHVDPGDLVVFWHDEPHLVVSTSCSCGEGHHVAVTADGLLIVLDDDDSLPDWAVIKANAA